MMIGKMFVREEINSKDGGGMGTPVVEFFMCSKLKC